MGLITNFVASRKRKALPGQQEFNVDALVSAFYTSSVQGVMPPNSYASFVNSFNSWVYIAIDKIAKTVAMLPLRLYKYEQGGKVLQGRQLKVLLKNMKSIADERMYLKAQGIEKVEVLQHPFLDLINRPNHLNTRFMFWYDLMTKLELSGYNGVYLVNNALGLPGEMWNLPLTKTGELKPIPDPVEVIKGYIYTDGNVNQRFTLEEILYLRYPDPGSPFSGFSPLRSQTYSYSIDNYLMKLKFYLLQNNAVVGLTLSTDKDLKEKQVDEIIAQIKVQYGGFKNSGNPLILHSGFQPSNSKNSSATMKNLETKVMGDEAKDKLLAAYDVPEGKVGLIKDVNRTTAEVMNESFMQETIRPKTMMIEEMLETFVLPRYDERLTLDFIIPENEQRELDIKERESNLKTGLTVVNEERSRLGMEEVPYGDKPIMQINMVPYDGEESSSEPEPEPKKFLKMIKHLSPEYWTDERKEIYWKEYIQKTDEWEKMFESVMQKYFKQQRKNVLNKLEEKSKAFEGMVNGWSFSKIKQYMKAKDATDQFNISKTKEAKRLREDTRPVYVTVMDEAGQNRMDDLSKTKAKSEFEFSFTDDVKDYLGDRLEMFSEEVTDTSFKQIKAILTDGFGEGLGIPAIADNLREKFNSWDQFRAGSIARTEVIASSSKADIEAVRQSGMKSKLKKIWIHSKDSNVRDTHRVAEEKYSDGVGINAKFHVGTDTMDSPGNGAEAAENINCRCVMGYVQKK